MDFGKRAGMLVHQQEPFNAEPTRAILGESALTALDAFYVRGHATVPQLDESSWRLEVGGLTERDLQLGIEDLRHGRFAQHELVATLQCAGNRRAGLLEVRDIPGEAPWGPGATGNARWCGVRLEDVLEAAGVRPESRHVAFVGADRSEEVQPAQLYGVSIPLAKALGEEVLLAYEMNGEPLRAVHGAPVRVVVPGYIGARSVKWVTRIELTSEPWEGYFQETSYRLLAPGQRPGPGVGMPLGEVALNADILSPEDGARVDTGAVQIRGYAFAGGERAVARVDVSADGGDNWTQAELLEDHGRWAWRLWCAQLDLAAGVQEVIARAWDTAANTQPERPESVWNPKGYANNSWARIHVRVGEPA